MNSHQAPRIGIVKLGAIGDVVNSLPFVNRLRNSWPDAHITWFVAPLAHTLVAGHPAVDEFVCLDVRRPGEWIKAWSELRGRHFDLVIDLQRIFKSGVLTWLTGAPRRLGFDRARCKELSWIFSNERIPGQDNPGVTVAQYLEFADYLELAPAAVEWHLPRDPWPHAADRPLIVVNVGASKEANQWYSDRWARLCERFVNECGATVELTGGPEDRGITAAVLRESQVPLGDRVGELDLRQTAGLLAAADLFVGCDTGPLHMAVAVQTPVIALFGAADPLRTGPFQQESGVIYRPASCSPCRKRSCFTPGHPCMTAIEPDSVFALACQQLEAVSRGPHASRVEGLPGNPSSAKQLSPALGRRQQ